jgi:hypothetical protein
MVARPRDDGERRYVCATGPGFHGCGHTYALAEPLELLVLEAVKVRLSGPDLAAALAGAAAPDTQASEATDRLAADQALLDELALAYANREVTMRDWLHAKAPIEQRMSADRRALSRLTNTVVLDGFVGSDALTASWDGLTLQRQHAIIRALLDHVLVGPAVRGRNKFDRSRFQPAWRH